MEERAHPDAFVRGQSSMKRATPFSPPTSRFEAIFDATPTPLLIVAPPDWVVVAVNDARVAATGTTREESVGRKLFDLFPDDPNDPGANGVEKLRASLERVVASKAADRMEVQRYSLQDASGRFVQRWWSPVNKPVIGSDGEVEFVIHRVDEVTDIVRMDLLLDSLPGMAYRCQVEEPWLMQYVSSGIKFVCSLSPEDLTTGRVTWGNLIHPADLPAINVELQEALTAHRHFNFHYRMADPHLGTRWMSEAGQGIYNKHGDAEALVGFIIDVTEHEEIQERLREAEHRYALAAKATGEIIWDRNLETSAVNRIIPESSAFATANPSEVNTHEWWESRIHPDDAETVQRGIQVLLDERRTHWSAEYRFMRPDGSYADIFDQGFLVPAEDGRTRRMVGAMQDISERKAAEAQLEQLQAELIHVSRHTAMGAMAATLAHELNQPLAAAGNYLVGSRNLVARDLSAEHAANVGLEEAAQQIHRAGEIIRRIRSLVKDDEARREEVSLKQLVLRVEKLTQASGICPNLTVSVSISEAADRLYVDHIQIEQVLLNLFRNACDAMRRLEKPEISVNSRLSTPGMVEVEVSDKGEGMSPATLSSLFTAYGASTTGGLGVGLSISRTIIEAHGGRISARNNEEKGVTFSFSVPSPTRAPETTLPADIRQLSRHALRSP